MNRIVIRRPRIEDDEELMRFFRLVIEDTFVKEGLGELKEDIESEIEVKRKYLKSDFVSQGMDRYFLLAVEGDRIVGTIEYGAASSLIDACTDGALKKLVEVGTVFVDPNYQRQGIGNLLLDAICCTLKSRGIEEFCLDSGYARAQQIWKKKFGEPDYLLPDYWGEGYDHMIWKITMEKMPKEQ